MKRTLGKLVGGALAGTIVLLANTASATLNVSIGDQQGAVGSTQTVTVSIDYDVTEPIIAADLVIAFDGTVFTTVSNVVNALPTGVLGFAESPYVVDGGTAGARLVVPIDDAFGTKTPLTGPYSGSLVTFDVAIDPGATAQGYAFSWVTSGSPRLNFQSSAEVPVDQALPGTFTVLKFYNAIADAAGVGEDDGTAQVAVLTNDVDETGADVSASAAVDSIDTNGTTGTATFAGGVVSYSPNGMFEALPAGQSANDTFTYTGSYTHPVEGAVTDTGTVTITINGVNDAPTFTSDPAGLTPTDEDAVYTYNITAADVDNGATLAIGATTKPAWLTLTDNGDGTATLTGTPPNAHVGDNDITLTVSDGIAPAVEQMFTIAVTNTNDDPTVANAIADQPSVMEDAAFSFTIPANTFEDVDVGDSLTLTSDEALDWLTFTDNEDGTATVSGTPTNSTDAGTTAITVTADDGNGGTPAQDTFEITVTAVNDDPVITTVAITPNSSLLAGGDITATVTASDEETVLGELDYRYVWKSGDTVIKDTGDLTATPQNILTQAEQDNFTAGRGDLGENYPITVDVTVTDGNSATDTDSAATYVGNEPPTIAWVGTSASPVNEGTAISVAVQVSDAGHAPQTDDIATLTLTVDGSPATPTPTPVLDGATGTLTFTIDTSQDTSIHTADKEFTVEVTVTDTAGATDSAQQVITVTDVNTDPVITSVTVEQADDGTTAALVPEDLKAVVAADDADAEDSGNLTYQYVWKKDGQTLTGAGDDAILTVAEQDAAGFMDGDSYEITVEVTVSDTDAPAGTDTLASAAATIGNEPPAIAWVGTTPSPVNEGDTITIAVQVDDAGHAPQADNITGLTVTVDGTPVTPTPTPVLDGVTGTLTFDIATDQDTSTHAEDNVFMVEVTVTDAGGSSATAEQQITVTDVNSSPTITGTPDAAVDQDAAYTFTPAVTDDDAEDQALVGVTEGEAFSIQNKPSWADFDTATGKLSGTPTNDDVGGTYNDIAIVFTDGDGAQAPLAAFSIVVNNVNDAPVADADEDATDEDTPKAIDVLTGDTDIDISGQFGAANVDGDALSVSAVTQPANGVVTNNVDGVTFDPNGEFEALDDQGTAQLTFNYTLSDGNGGENEATVTVTVNGVNDAPVIGALRIAGQRAPVSRDAMESVSLSKPEDIEQLMTNATEVTTDAEGNGLTYGYTWTLERKDQSPVYVDSGAVNALTTSDIGGPFQKNDKVTVEVTVTDDSTDSKATAKTKTVTLGNPPWFPTIDLAELDTNFNDLAPGFYQVEILDGASALVATLNVRDKAAVDPIDYIAAESPGLAAGSYTIDLYKYVEGTFVEVALGEALVVDEYGLATAQVPAEYDFEPAARALVANPRESSGNYDFAFEVANAAGWELEIIHVATATTRAFAATFQPIENVIATDQDVVKAGVYLARTGAYQWRVRGVNPEGSGDWVSGANFTIAALVEPNTKPTVSVPTASMLPVGDQGTAVGATAPITFQWDAAAGARVYHVFVATQGGEVVINRQPVMGNTTYGPVNLAPGAYVWHVIATNSKGSGTWSAPGVQFRIRPPLNSVVPLVESILDPNDLGLFELQITWEVAPTRQQVLLSNASTGASIAPTMAATGLNTVFVIPPAYRAPGTYYYQVRGIRGATKGRWSQEGTYTVAAAAGELGAVELSGPAGGNITATWTGFAPGTIEFLAFTLKPTGEFLAVTLDQVTVVGVGTMNIGTPAALAESGDTVYLRARGRVAGQEPGPWGLWLLYTNP